MDCSLSYATILKQTVQKATIAQPRLQAIQLYPVCDADSGHFLILATGWDKQQWIDSILFHARLVNDRVLIEQDNFEEGLTHALIAAGINAEHIVTSLEPHGNSSQTEWVDAV
ncbi:XisI protein [Lusitaniella coriacea LEGE 07157]|uniref:XisI protein n=1 Tax=Lusitaniella coriacea LEGE 07157 TaxID=945747 RepID=A0A8J7J2L1_9CYAN|nr:element excision factor XisI family protein [Lusitaniella coriacea]MBE9116404.1 XisI protein [Lusitaniella coriacea LEGE 07157]